MSCIRRVCAATARVGGGGAATAAAAAAAGAASGKSPSWSSNKAFAPRSSSSPIFLCTSHRCASSRGCAGDAGGRDNVSFLQKLKNLYREFQLSEDRKLDAVAAAEALEGQDRFFDDERFDGPRHPSLAGGRRSLSGTSFQDSPLISCNPSLCPRSVLFVPGSKPRAMEKITSLNADCFILDLEDSVGCSSKRQARENIRNFVEGLQKKQRMHRDAQVSTTANAVFKRQVGETEAAAHTDAGSASASAVTAETSSGTHRYPRLIVRINSPDFDPATAMLDLQLVGLLGPAIEGVAIPKTTPRSYSLIKDYLHPNHQLWAFFESPQSVIQAPTICKQHVYQYAVMGYNDLSMKLQLPMASASSPSDDGLSGAAQESLHIAARLPLWQCTTQVLLAARAHNMFVMDAVFNDPTDKVGFRRNLQESKALGLNGKTLIHPGQIEPTNAIYTPSTDEVTWATRIVEAVQGAQGGVATVDGKMVEDLHKREALRLLAMHRSTEAERQLRAREAAEEGKAGEAAEGSEDGTREPRRAPSRHRSLN
ncbi:hypothetical protein ABL78_6687 [Leptomonas seymouri]|uniref:HpcH/HpaI aldolase/citrate lyase domain-containing protein n=1 Tax=Leptomonas seymouri TaxID=5684 RepID=A0A0N1IHZ0_LEPSE|nr:hypothetical protein ABL78_6687 [Leptomonas seymouri]|eukprot:KPI84253.1 hypothetical protein ABL78_6687 [Leptomonas seymouri]